MIERFYTPYQGKIFFDGTEITDVSLKTLRESIGYVSQEPVLIIGTVKENLFYGNKDATEEDIKYAINQANAGFVYDLENGIDTYVGSGAVLNLSGGQKQRIAIARALLKKPKILILDEATSALDPKSEKEVQDAIDSIQTSKTQLTIIIIAHRL
jgi:ABC-type multidrug transport system fused ATPase/permease subunit